MRCSFERRLFFHHRLGFSTLAAADFIPLFVLGNRSMVPRPIDGCTCAQRKTTRHDASERPASLNSILDDDHDRRILDVASCQHMRRSVHGPDLLYVVQEHFWRPSSFLRCCFGLRSSGSVASTQSTSERAGMFFHGKHQDRNINRFLHKKQQQQQDLFG